MTGMPGDEPPARTARAREQALKTASQLFYARGVRAVGMDEIVARSGVAKTTIYRHFRTKDDLIRAFLDREDETFWTEWEAITHSLEGRAALDALCDWIGKRVERDLYRGCPQINAAAEFADASHPARTVARRHKEEMYRRLQSICRQAGVRSPSDAAMPIALLFDGAFTSGGRLKDFDAAALLRRAVRGLLRDDG